MRTIDRVMKRTAVSVGVLAAVGFVGLTAAGRVSAQSGSPAVGNPSVLEVVQQLQQQVAALQESLTATQGQLQSVQPRTFYMTTGVADGAGAPAACSAGFHMASLWEIHDTTGLRYDTAQGVDGRMGEHGWALLQGVSLGCLHASLRRAGSSVVRAGLKGTGPESSGIPAGLKTGGYVGNGQA